MSLSFDLPPEKHALYFSLLEKMVYLLSPAHFKWIKRISWLSWSQFWSNFGRVMEAEMSLYLAPDLFDISMCSSMKHGIWPCVEIWIYNKILNQTILNTIILKSCIRSYVYTIWNHYNSKNWVYLLTAFSKLGNAVAVGQAKGTFFLSPIKYRNSANYE